MKLNDAVFGVLLLLLGGAVLWIVRGYPKIPGQQVGPALFPGLIAIGLCLGGAALLVRGIRARAVHPWFEPREWMRSRRHVIACAAVVGSVLFYILVADRLGFLLTAPLMLFACFKAMGVPTRRAVVVAVIATLAIHFAFYKLLRVPLPWGVLTPYAF